MSRASAQSIRDSSRRWRTANPEQAARSLRRYRDIRIAAIQWYKATHPCVDCGESDPIVLEFDHARGVKSFTIAQQFRYGRARLWEEIQKCDVVCSNCHTRRTYMRNRHGA